MAFQFSVAVRNAAIDAIETAIGAAPTLEIRSGTIPANAGTADTGSTLLASMVLPADWMTAAANGSKTLLGTWSDTSADAAGIASFFRIKVSTTCHIQGTITATGGGGDMTLDNTNIAPGQQIVITAFTLTAGGA